jgi:DNA-binding NarL/FixJ family response regulator
MYSEVNFLIADDHPDFIEGMKMFINKSKEYIVVGTATNGYELLNHPLLSKADIVLLDCEMPVMDGIETARQIDLLYPNKKMIAVTMYEDRRTLVELLGAGFKGYVYKPEFGARIGTVVERVMNNEYVFDEKVLNTKISANKAC